MKTTSLEHVVHINYFECQNKNKQFMYTTCSELVVFMYRTDKSMNNLLSYCVLVDARISASEKYLPVPVFCFKRGEKIMCVTYERFCCCCCNVVTCSKVFAILGLIIGILIMISGFLQLTVVNSSQLWADSMPPLAGFAYEIGLDYTGIIWIWIVITVVCMIADALLLVGISKKRPNLLIPWLVLRMILLVVC